MQGSNNLPVEGMAHGNIRVFKSSFWNALNNMSRQHSWPQILGEASPVLQAPSYWCEVDSPML
jgi:hypothetical protein